MVFASHVFLYWYLPAVLLLYYSGPRKLRNFSLTAASYLFYGWAAPQFIVILAWSTIVDYVCGNFIYGHWLLPGRHPTDAQGQPAPSPWQRRLFVAISLVSNLGLLGFFKYFVFAQQNINAILEQFGRTPTEVLMVVLPIGISFYTFESISYNLDIYYGRARPAIAWVEELAGTRPRGFWRQLGLELRALNAFACYITQFPHLVAGPIIRYQDLERQIHMRSHTVEKFSRGVFFFALGMAKKILIANPMGRSADIAFSAGSLSTLDAWYGVVSYAFQIYFDFSGYSDMAIGLGLMVGFEFNKNFDSPYQAESITDFWRRWHISLSTWLRDYLYIPLGGNRLGAGRTYVNLLTVMVLGGLWHGASWNFAIWGAIHGVWLSLERVFGKRSFYVALPAALRVAVTFLIVNLAWVFFRAPTLGASAHYVASLFGGGQPAAATTLSRAVLYSPYQLLCFVVAAAIAFFGVQTWDLAKRITPMRAMAAVGLFVWAQVAMSTQSFNPFLYFRF